MKNLDLILTRLRENPGQNLRAIEDLTKFREYSEIVTRYEDDPEHFSYLLISGHPSTRGSSPIVILGGNVNKACELLEYLPKGPYTIMETEKIFLKALEGHIPQDAKIYHERRMELLRSDFKSVSSSRVRKILESDDVALAKFYGAPPQAAMRMRNWINGAKALLGIFEGVDLISMGSTFCTIPEGWSLVSIKTREDHRRKGLALEVTSALCKNALENVDKVELTVLSDNASAIALYEKLGFVAKEERVWIDCGSGSKPFF